MMATRIQISVTNESLLRIGDEAAAQKGWNRSQYLMWASTMWAAQEACERIKDDSRWTIKESFLQVELTALETELWGCDDTQGWAFRTHVHGKAQDLLQRHSNVESARVFVLGDTTKFHGILRAKS